jgi:hypothetical protein
MGRIAAFSLLALLAASCESHRLPTERDSRITAARTLSRRFGVSNLSAWNVRAEAAAEDCGVLLVATSIRLEDSMIETMHYGTGAYDVTRGGIQRFCREHSFRGVAYRDKSGHTWTYGATDVAEAGRMKPCH